MPSNRQVIAVLGGSGNEGRGLALRWADRGHQVIIGSRTVDRAEEAAAELRNLLGPQASIAAMTNGDAAAAAQIVVLCVPFAAQQATVREVAPSLKGKILIDVTVPLVPPKVSKVQLPQGGSAVSAVQEMLGADVRVVSAFQNISAHNLIKLDEPVDCEVLVCADDPDAADTVVALSEEIGLMAWNAGPLANSAAAEAMTSVLISLNRRYKVPGAGIRITGMRKSPD